MLKVYKNKDIKMEFNNPGLKEWFLKTIKQELSHKTYQTYEKLLYRVSQYEEKIKGGKDSCHFNKNEILDMISFFRFKEASCNTLISMLRRYIDFAMKEDVGYLTTGINFAAEIKSSDLRKVINKRAHNEANELNYEKVKELAEQLANPRDKAIIMGIFNLIRGENFSDLINLKRENISWEDKAITLVNEDGEIRLIEDIDDYTLDVFRMALKERVYYSDNKDIEIAKEREKLIKEKRKEPFNPNEVEIKKRLILTNDYVLRPNLMKYMEEPETDTSDITVKSSLIYNILKEIKSWTDKDWITSVDIYKAGVVHRMKKYMQKMNKESLTVAEVEELAKKYDMDIKNPYRIYKLYFNQLALDKLEKEETD